MAEALLVSIVRRNRVGKVAGKSLGLGPKSESKSLPPSPESQTPTPNPY